MVTAVIAPVATADVAVAAAPVPFITTFRADAQPLPPVCLFSCNI